MAPFFFEGPSQSDDGKEIRGKSARPEVDQICPNCKFCDFELTTIDPQIACEKHQWEGFKDSSLARRNCPFFQARQKA